MGSDDRLGGRVNVRPTKFEFVDTNCDQTFDKELECIIVLWVVLQEPFRVTSDVVRQRFLHDKALKSTYETTDNTGTQAGTLSSI